MFVVDFFWFVVVLIVNNDDMCFLCWVIVRDLYVCCSLKKEFCGYLDLVIVNKLSWKVKLMKNFFGKYFFYFKWFYKKRYGWYMFGIR